MRTRDLARPYPTAPANDDAREAARLIVRERLPALLVIDRDEYPYAIVPAARVVHALVPEYVREDPLLASLIDDRLDMSPPSWRARTTPSSR
jgi:hypothetical protein